VFTTLVSADHLFEAVGLMSTERSSGWVGVGVFAGVVILMSGLFSAFQGLVALIGPNAYYAVARGSLFVFDVNGWGWWNLIIGIVFVLVGIALLTGAGWARIVAIILAILSAIGQLFLIPVQPWWAVIVIAIDVLIVYALTAHGNELRD
jgi:hypothetical protein